MTREDIEQKMDELMREYAKTRDPEIPAEIYRLARQLKNSITERASLTPDPPPLLISGFPVWRVSIDNPHRSD
jgi:hypothetical protein